MSRLSHLAAVTAVFALVVAACGSSTGTATTVGATTVTTAAPAPTSVTTAAPAPTTTTTQPATPTTTLPKILSGTYAVPDEVPPGTYRFWFRAVRLDENMEEIDNLIIGGRENSAYGIVIVQPTDSFIRVDNDSWIITVEDFGKPLDPIANRYAHGIYLVGYDLEPGRYEVHPDGDQAPYWARLDDEMEIIDSGTGVEILEFTVEEGDFALEYNGPLRLVP